MFRHCIFFGRRDPYLQNMKLVANNSIPWGGEGNDVYTEVHNMSLFMSKQSIIANKPCVGAHEGTMMSMNCGQDLEVSFLFFGMRVLGRMWG